MRYSDSCTGEHSRPRENGKRQGDSGLQVDGAHREDSGRRGDGGPPKGWDPVEQRANIRCPVRKVTRLGAMSPQVTCHDDNGVQVAVQVAVVTAASDCAQHITRPWTPGRWGSSGAKAEW